MKDLYSFSRNENEHMEFYEKSKKAYKNIFARAGLADRTYLTFASGGVFSKYSHEFQTLSEAGEDLIFICDKCQQAVNKEIIKEQNTCPECGNKKLHEEKSIEVGNIFSLGTRFSEALNLIYLDEKGEKKAVVMGSYGIGPGRLMGTVVECLSDEAGIVWPVEIAPFKVHLIELGNKSEVQKKREEIKVKLEKMGVEVLCDDRDLRPGEKFADADLLGLPLRIVISEKTLASGEFEIKERKEGKVSLLKEADLLDFVKKYK
jgi:prolyl-tRNA synthetase